MKATRKDTQNLYKIALINSMKNRSLASYIRNKFYECGLDDFVEEISLDFFSYSALCKLDNLLILYLETKYTETKFNLINDIYNVIYAHYLSINHWL